jgi:hypothetical protein
MCVKGCIVAESSEWFRCCLQYLGFRVFFACFQTLKPFHAGADINPKGACLDALGAQAVAHTSNGRDADSQVPQATSSHRVPHALPSLPS